MGDKGASTISKENSQNAKERRSSRKKGKRKKATEGSRDKIQFSEGDGVMEGAQNQHNRYKGRSKSVTYGRRRSFGNLFKRQNRSRSAGERSGSDVQGENFDFTGNQVANTLGDNSDSKLRQHFRDSFSRLTVNEALARSRSLVLSPSDDGSVLDGDTCGVSSKDHDTIVQSSLLNIPKSEQDDISTNKDIVKSKTSTLPKAKKKTSLHSNVNMALIENKPKQTEIQDLKQDHIIKPLDKRKYIIDESKHKKNGEGNATTSYQTDGSALEQNAIDSVRHETAENLKQSLPSSMHFSGTISSTAEELSSSIHPDTLEPNRRLSLCMLNEGTYQDPPETSTINNLPANTLQKTEPMTKANGGFGRNQDKTHEKVEPDIMEELKQSDIQLGTNENATSLTTHKQISVSKLTEAEKKATHLPSKDEVFQNEASASPTKESDSRGRTLSSYGQSRRRRSYVSPRKFSKTKLSSVEVNDNSGNILDKEANVTEEKRDEEVQTDMCVGENDNANRGVKEEMTDRPNNWARSRWKDIVSRSVKKDSTEVIKTLDAECKVQTTTAKTKKSLGKGIPVVDISLETNTSSQDLSSKDVDVIPKKLSRQNQKRTVETNNQIDTLDRVKKDRKSLPSLLVRRRPNAQLLKIRRSYSCTESGSSIGSQHQAVSLDDLLQQSEGLKHCTLNKDEIKPEEPKTNLDENVKQTNTKLTKFSKSTKRKKSKENENITPSSEGNKRRKSSKLSIATIVSLKNRLARIRKSKRNQNVGKDQINNMTEDDEIAGITPSVAFENDINISFSKLIDLEETAIIEPDLIDPSSSIFEKKHLRFEEVGVDELTEEELIRKRQTNTRLISCKESKGRQRQKKVLNCCKKFVAFLFSHIGLCSLVVAYCILGGFIFRALEGDAEVDTKRGLRMRREQLVEDIWNKAFEVNTVNNITNGISRINKYTREKFKFEVNVLLFNYSQEVFRQTKDMGWDGKDDSEEGAIQWSFPSSLLYAITVMTTIGCYCGMIVLGCQCK